MWLKFSGNHDGAIADLDTIELEESEYVSNDMFETTWESYIDYKTDLKGKLGQLKQECKVNGDYRLADTGNYSSLAAELAFGRPSIMT